MKNKTIAALGAFLCIGALGCGSVGGAGELDSEATGTEGQAFLTLGWKNWGEIGNGAFDFPFAIDSTPIVCGNQASLWFIVARRGGTGSNAQKYYTKAFDNRVWGAENTLFSSSKQFWSGPACSMFFPYGVADGRFLLAGKALDNKIYAREGLADAVRNGTMVGNVPTNVSPAAAAAGSSWVQVGTGTYADGSADGTNGFPALATNGNKFVLAARNGNQVQAFYRLVAGTTWTSTSKSLPTGVTGKGVPAITYMVGNTNKFLILVRTNAGGSSDGMHWIYHDGTAFLGSWASVSVPSPGVKSDPAAEFGFSLTNPADPNYWWLTVYYGTTDASDGNKFKIKQVTVRTPNQIPGTASYPHAFIDPSSSYTLVAPPRALFARAIEAGYRSAVTRSSTGKVLLVEDIGFWSDVYPTSP